MKKVAILQSNYIPWKGYFHIIQKADHFVFLDTAQYTNRDWRNRNQIKTPNGKKWLTIPTDGTQSKRIIDVKIDNSSNWSEKHFKCMQFNYNRCKFYEELLPFLQKTYLENEWEYLSELNREIILEISKMLGLKTEFHLSSDFSLPPGKNEKIISVVHQLNGTHYITGPAARSYLDEDAFFISDIKVEWMDYSQYPHYEQPWPPFAHDVSVLDLLFCVGKAKAADYIWNTTKLEK